MQQLSVSKQEPGYWDSLSNYDPAQALVIVAPYFNPDEYEMKKLLHFMENGNDVFISTMNISYEATQMMKCDINAAEGLMYYFEQSEGSDLLVCIAGQTAIWQENILYLSRQTI